MFYFVLSVLNTITPFVVYPTTINHLSRVSNPESNVTPIRTEIFVITHKCFTVQI